MSVLNHRLKSGAIWAFLDSVGMTIVLFAGGIVLARLLDPADFGVFIAVSAYATLVMAQIRFGLPEALIQGQDITPAEVAGAFWTMQGIATAAAVLFIAIGHWLQGFYADDRFITIAVLTALTFFFVPYVVTGSALLKRDLAFKALAQIRVVSALASLVITFPLALAGAGPLSLVLGGLSGAVFNVVLLARLRFWTPFRRPRGVGRLLAYAWRSNLASTQQIAAERVDKMLIGALVSTTALGLYNRAFSLARMPLEQFAESVRELIFSGLSRCQSDATRTTRLQYKMLCAVASVTFPFLLLFLFVAEDFIRILYGEKWLPAALPLQVMTVGVFSATVSLSLQSLCAANNLVSALAWLGFIQFIATIVLVPCTAPFGLVMIAAGIALRDVLMMVLLQQVVARSRLDVTGAGLLHALAPAIVATAVAGLVTLGLCLLLPLRNTAPGLPAAFYHLSLAGGGVVVSYSLTLLLLRRLWPDHAPLDATLSFFGDVLTRLPPVTYGIMAVAGFLRWVRGLGRRCFSRLRSPRFGSGPSRPPRAALPSGGRHG